MKIFISLFFTILVSCGNSYNESSALNMPDNPTSEADGSFSTADQSELNLVLSNSKMFSEIKYYCEKTGGQFLDKVIGCLCSGDQMFAGKGRPGCYDYEGRDVHYGGLDRTFTKSTSEDVFPVDITWMKDKKESRDLIKLQSHLWTPYMHVARFVKYQNLSVENLKSVLGFFDINDGDGEMAMVEEVNNVTIMGDKRSFKKNTFSASDTLPMQEIINHYSGTFPFSIDELQGINNLVWKGQNFHQRKCLVHCEVFKGIKNSTHELELRKVIRSGQVFRQFITIKKNESYLNQFFIQVLPMNKIDIVMEMKQSFSFDKYTQQVEVHHLKQVKKFSWILEGSLSTKSEIVRDEYDRFGENQNSKILLCDTSIQLEKIHKQSLLDKISYFSPELNSSFFGMFEKYKISNRKIIESINMNKNGILHGEGSEHGLDLMEFADDHTVVPMAIFPCLSLVSEWAKTASHKNVRVVNLSASKDVLDMQSCKEQQYTKNILSYGKKFLWVQAAGNDVRD